MQENLEGLPENAPELRLAALLDEYRRTRELRLSGETRRTQSASGLLISGLQQRLLSSVEAFSKTLMSTAARSRNNEIHHSRKKRRASSEATC